MAIGGQAAFITSQHFPRRISGSRALVGPYRTARMRGSCRGAGNTPPAAAARRRAGLGYLAGLLGDAERSSRAVACRSTSLRRRLRTQHTAAGQRFCKQPSEMGETGLNCWQKPCGFADGIRSMLRRFVGEAVPSES